MTTRLLLPIVLLAIPAVVLANEPYWQIWDRERGWRPYPGPPPTDGTRAPPDARGYRRCRGQIRRYVVETKRAEGGRCVVGTEYEYYCLPIAGAELLTLTPAQAPACGPPVACK